MERYFQIGIEEFHESWLMKPFVHTTYLSRQQKTFNQQLSRARVVVENAFGQQGRWRCLLKKNESNTLNMPKIIFMLCSSTQYM